MIFSMESKSILSLGLTAFLIALGINTYNSVTAQLEIPEAVTINEDDTSENLDRNSTNVTYTDDDLGFSITYPSSWEESSETTNAYNLVRFDSPDGTAGVYIFLWPSEDEETLKTFGDEFVKNDEQFRISEYYRNSTTKLADQPAIRASGTYFNTVTPYEEALGYKSYNSKTLQVYTFSEANNGFFGIILHADDTESYDKHLPDVEAMIKSFKLISGGPIISEEDE